MIDPRTVTLEDGTTEMAQSVRATDDPEIFEVLTPSRIIGVTVPPEIPPDERLRFLMDGFGFTHNMED